jgi:hypothetical protein
MTKFVGGPLDGAEAKTSAARWLLPIPTPHIAPTASEVTVTPAPPRTVFQHVYVRENDTLKYQGEEPT